MTAAGIRSRARIITPITGSVPFGASCRAPMPVVLHLISQVRYRPAETSGAAGFTGSAAGSAATPGHAATYPAIAHRNPRAGAA